MRFLLSWTSLCVAVAGMGCGDTPNRAQTPRGLEHVTVASAASSISFDRGLCVLAADGQAQCVSTYYEESKSSAEASLMGAQSLVEGGVCGLFADHSVKCDDDGLVTVVATNVRQAQVYNRYICAVTLDGAISCHRFSYGGEWAPALSQPATQVTVSDDKVCALLEDHTVLCWQRETQAAPTIIPGLPGATQIALTDHQSTGSRPGLIWGCALVTGGQVRCWNSTQTGAALTVIDRDAKGQALTGVTSIAAAGTRGCAITENGSVHCWGSFVLNPSGDASDGAWTIPGVNNAAALTLGPRDSSYDDCALSTRGELSCWGGSHQVGPSFNFVPIPSP
jgi:hypothetical protein